MTEPSALPVEDVIEQAAKLGQKLEDLVVGRGNFQISGEPDKILIALWSLFFDYNKGIILLLSSKLYGSAFALWRPAIEAVIRAHVALKCSPEDLIRIKKDTYQTNFAQVGSWIDREFGLESLMENFLKDARPALHSFAHSGLMQLGRRFDGGDVAPSYSDKDVLLLVRSMASASYMATNLIARHFGFEEEVQLAGDALVEWGERSGIPPYVPDDPTS